MNSSYFLPSYECALSLLDKPYGLLNLPDHFGSLFKAEVQFQNSNVGREIAWIHLLISNQKKLQP